MIQEQPDSGEERLTANSFQENQPSDLNNSFTDSIVSPRRPRTSGGKALEMVLQDISDSMNLSLDSREIVCSLRASHEVDQAFEARAHRRMPSGLDISRIFDSLHENNHSGENKNNWEEEDGEGRGRRRERESPKRQHRISREFDGAEDRLKLLTR